MKKTRHLIRLPSQALIGPMIPKTLLHCLDENFITTLNVNEKKKASHKVTIPSPHWPNDSKNPSSLLG
jgi:hypothetical protein